MITLKGFAIVPKQLSYSGGITISKFYSTEQEAMERLKNNSDCYITPEWLHVKFVEVNIN